MSVDRLFAGLGATGIKLTPWQRQFLEGPLPRRMLIPPRHTGKTEAKAIIAAALAASKEEQDA